MEQFLVLLIPACILWSWLSPIGFLNRTVEGAVIRIMPIPLLARIKRHALHIAVTLIVTCALIVADLASSWWLLVAMLSALGLLAISQDYTVTTSGIRVGNGNFRRWTEFAGVYRSPAGAKLQTIGRGRDLPIWLAGSRDDDEFVYLLRRLVRDSYKGKTEPYPVPGGHDNAPAPVPEISPIAAFTQEHS